MHINFFTLPCPFPPKKPEEIKLKIGRSQEESRKEKDGPVPVRPNKGIPCEWCPLQGCKTVALAHSHLCCLSDYQSPWGLAVVKLLLWFRSSFFFWQKPLPQALAWWSGGRGPLRGQVFRWMNFPPRTLQALKSKIEEGGIEISRQEVVTLV